MLFISPHAEFMLSGFLQPEDVYHEKTGRYITTRPGIDCQFRHGGAPDWAMEQALGNSRFQSLWNGLPDGTDRRMHVGTYDTDKRQAEEGWTDETRKQVEEFLLNDVAYGNRYILAEPPEHLRNLPWPNYDSTHHNSIVRVAKEIDVSLEFVLEYEQGHKNRPAVIEAIHRELGDEADVEELVPA